MSRDTRREKPCTIPKSSKKVFRNYERTLWATVDHLDYKAIIKLQGEERFNKHRSSKGLSKILEMIERASEKDKAEGGYYDIAKSLVVCPSCFNTPEIPLERCLISMSTSTSNINQHRQITHKGKSLPEQSRIVLGNKDSPSVVTNNLGSTGTIERFAKSLPISRKAALSTFHQALFVCINDLGFPSRTVEKPQFRTLLRVVRENANLLKDTDFDVSHHYFATLRTESYLHFIQLVTLLGNRIRSFYRKRCGNYVPFCVICHDVWQGLRKEVLGVSLMFCNPRNCEMYKIPIGLVPCKGHSALDISFLTQELMTSFGFSTSDLSGTVSDNTNSAIKASKYLLKDDDSKCDMHKAELIMKHATGLVVRKKTRS
jgi:hypothetical protein